jgi:UDP-glucose 4-epimerase
VKDVVRACLLASTSERAPGAVVNVASGHSASLLELIALIREAVGPEAAHLGIEHGPSRPGDVRASSADLTRARELLGFDPRISLGQGLADVVRSFRAASAKAA